MRHSSPFCPCARQTTLLDTSTHENIALLFALAQAHAILPYSTQTPMTHRLPFCLCARQTTLLNTTRAAHLFALAQAVCMQGGRMCQSHQHSLLCQPNPQLCLHPRPAMPLSYSQSKCNQACDRPCVSLLSIESIALQHSTTNRMGHSAGHMTVSTTCGHKLIPA